MKRSIKLLQLCVVAMLCTQGAMFAAQASKQASAPTAAELTNKQKELCNQQMPFWEKFTAMPDSKVGLLKHVVGAFGGFKVGDVESVQKHGILSANAREKMGLGKTPRKEAMNYFSTKMMDGKQNQLPDEYDRTYFAPADPNRKGSTGTWLDDHDIGLVSPSRQVGLLVRKDQTNMYEGLDRVRNNHQNYQLSKISFDSHDLKILDTPEVIKSSIAPKNLIFSYPVTKDDHQKLAHEQKLSAGHWENNLKVMKVHNALKATKKFIQSLDNHINKQGLE